MPDEPSGKRPPPKFTEDDLKDLNEDLKDKLKQAKEDNVPDEETEKLFRLQKFLESTRYHPRLFRDLAAGRAPGVSFFLCDVERRELPKHINDDGYVSEVLVRWRLKRGI